MLDGGLGLEPERQAVVEEMAKAEPGSWSTAQLALVKEGMEPGAEGIPLKRLFGSDFPFREASRFAELVCEQSDLKMSLAVGGLSNVWGAGTIPFCADDISDWPVQLKELIPYYRECFEEMDLAATNDELARDFPLYTERSRPLRPSRQAAEFLADLDRNREKLKRKGISFGSSRLAVKAPGPDGRGGCVYCGLCLHGCPYGFIYNSTQSVKSLLSRPGFSYQPDVVVERLEESGARVTLHARGRSSGEELHFAGRQAFLACGAVPTTAILLDSLSAWDQPLEMKDSQYFLAPVLRFRSTPNLEREQLHTLAQLFLEVRDPGLSAKGIHISIYTYNDLLPVALRKQVGWPGRMFPALPRALAQRLLIFGGYLHSTESPAIEVLLTRSKGGKKQVLLRGLERRSSAQIVRKLMRKLTANSFLFKAVPLAPFARPSLPGRGFHFGGTFPMSRHPGKFQSDLAGRPIGFLNVHVVDATVFPSIPAPNLTLTVMANARRISAAACEM